MDATELRQNRAITTIAGQFAKLLVLIEECETFQELKDRLYEVQNDED